MPNWRLNRVIHGLKNDAVIAYPTDTIWGFGCHPLSSRGIDRLLQIKQRSLKKGLILLSSDLDLFQSLVDPAVLHQHWQKLQQPYPRPRTWIVNASAHCPDWLTGGSGRVAIRITDKPLITDLCSAIGAPLVSTSANIAGRRSARNRLRIQKQFASQLDFIVEDHLQHSVLNSTGRASEIIELDSGNTLRC